MKPYQFFKEQAGYSYDPKTETQAQGRHRCALSLARAERLAKEKGMDFQWEPCDTTSEEFSNKRPFYRLWACQAHLEGEVVGSLGGIDFGRDVEPWGQPYKRVVEAELALEALI